MATDKKIENENEKQEEEDNPYDSMIRSLTNRGKNKRKVKLVENQLMQFAFGESDSEDDEEYTVADDDLDSDDSNADNRKEDSDDDEDDSQDSSESDDDINDEETSNIRVIDVLSAIKNQPQNLDLPISYDAESSQDTSDVAYKKPLLVCGICLDSEESDRDEILECDNCGITVHEGCYGVIDVEDDDKSNSDAPTEPWFCEPCKAGFNETPICELCPNTGGIYKQTDTGKWVHLVCALYTPYIGYRNVSKLQTVIMEDIKPSMWGSTECMYCVDDNFSKTGVCINCDAGMCKATFHVTCAQKNGFLSDIPDRGDDDQLNEDLQDLLYAHCKLHSDKMDMKKRKNSWLAFKAHMSKFKHNEYPIEKERIETSLKQASEEFKEFRRHVVISKPPIQEYPRLLSSCPEACMLLARKAEILGLLKHPGYNVAAAVTKGRFLKHEANLSAEFVNYFFKREMQVNETEHSLKNAEPILLKLQKEQRDLTKMSEECHGKLEKVLQKKEQLMTSCKLLHQCFCKLSGKNLKLPAVLKPKNEKEAKAKIVESTKLLNEIVNKCATCKSMEDQHLLIKCETCKNYYHLACVDPPLTRIPKKSDNYIWQCTECDSSDESEIEVNIEAIDEDGPRKKRAIKEPEKYTPEAKINPFSDVFKRKSQKSTDSSIPTKKKKKTIVKPNKDSAKDSLQEKKSKKENLNVKKKKERPPKPLKVKPPPEVFGNCVICSKDGDKTNLVKCDECKNSYHFKTCLDPPYSKSPKGKFYGWICEDCDSSEEEEDDLMGNE